MSISEDEWDSLFLEVVKRRNQNDYVFDRLLRDAVVASLDVVEHRTVRREIERHIVAEGSSRPARHRVRLAFRNQFLIADLDILRGLRLVSTQTSVIV